MTKLGLDKVLGIAVGAVMLVGIEVAWRVLGAEAKLKRALGL